MHLVYQNNIFLTRPDNKIARFERQYTFKKADEAQIVINETVEVINLKNNFP